MLKVAKSEKPKLILSNNINLKREIGIYYLFESIYNLIKTCREANLKWENQVRAAVGCGNPDLIAHFLLKLHGDLQAVVVDGLSFGDLAVADDGGAELAGGIHAGEGAVAFSDLQRGGGVVPAERDVGELAFFVGVGLVVVLMERELGIRAGIDADLHRGGRLLRGVLGILAVERDDTACADEEREAVERAFAAERPAAVEELVREEVEPLGADGEPGFDGSVIVFGGVLREFVGRSPAELELTRIKILVVVDAEGDLLALLQLDVGGFVAGIGRVPVLDDQLVVEPGIF